MKTTDKILLALVVGVCLALLNLTNGYQPPPSFTDVVVYSSIADPLAVAYLAGFTAWAGGLWIVRRALAKTLSCEGRLARNAPWLPKAGMLAMIGASYLAMMFVSVIAAFAINLLMYITGDDAAIWADNMLTPCHVAIGVGFWVSAYGFAFAAGLIVKGDPFTSFKVGTELFVASIHDRGTRWHVHFDPKPSQSDRAVIRRELAKCEEAIERLGDRRPRVIHMDSYLLAGKKGRKALVARFADKLGYEYEYSGQPTRLNRLQRKVRVLRYPQLKEAESKGVLDYTQAVTFTR